MDYQTIISETVDLGALFVKHGRDADHSGEELREAERRAKAYGTPPAPLAGLILSSRVLGMPN